MGRIRPSRDTVLVSFNPGLCLSFPDIWRHLLTSSRFTVLYIFDQTESADAFHVALGVYLAASGSQARSQDHCAQNPHLSDHLSAGLLPSGAHLSLSLLR